MRALFITTSLSWPLSFGGEIRRWNILQGLLDAASTLDVIVFQRDDSPPSQEAFAGCGRLITVHSRHLQLSALDQASYATALGRGALTLSSSLPFEYRLNREDDLPARLQREVDFSAYDLAWVSTARLAYRVGPIGCRRVVLDADDFGYVRDWQLLRHSPWYGAKVWNYVDVLKLWWHERRLHKLYSAVVRCSDEDRLRHPADNVVVIPNGTRIPPATNRSPDQRILFVGDIGYEPNRQGLEWFLLEVWPKIRSRVPAAALDIVGRKPPPDIVAANGKHGVCVHGFVEDLAKVYAQAACSVVPLLAGGGTRLKILESLAHETPVVATTLGAFGIPADASHGLVRADHPDTFADHCVACLSQPQLHTAPAAAGRQLVRDQYDWESIRRRVAELALRVATAPS